MRSGPAAHRHAVWVAALAVAVLLPMGSMRRETPTPRRASMPHWLRRRRCFAARRRARVLLRRPWPIPLRLRRTISLAETTAAILIGVYLLFVLFRVARLAMAAIRTVALRRSAHPAPISKVLERVWSRCQDRVRPDGRGAALLRSHSPARSRRDARSSCPRACAAKLSEEVLTTAIGHEMAHIARRDFACNLLYEILRLPVSFHPAAWLIRRGIEGAREMACDELVAGRLIGGGRLRAFHHEHRGRHDGAARLGHTLGVLDGDNLEERIRRLVERPAANLKRARLLLATALAALAICAVVASSLALTARAQGGTSDLMKTAAAAYNRGDYQEAANLLRGRRPPGSGQCESQAFPRQCSAATICAGDGSRQSRCRSGPTAIPRCTGARSSATSRRSKGMMMLLVNTKQFADAHDWALKAIQVDASDKTAYYTAGFVDWSLTYPDYAAARKAAGMQPADPGNIPDASLRQNLRTQHGAQIEDGFRMLQIASTTRTGLFGRHGLHEPAVPHPGRNGRYARASRGRHCQGK